jgi:DNA topoisomerase-1
VTDGVTNASLPRGTAPEEVTLEYALNLLKVRAEQAPTKRPARGAKKAIAPKKKPAAKKAAAPKAKKAAKKTAKKTV